MTRTTTKTTTTTTTTTTVGGARSEDASDALDEGLVAFDPSFRIVCHNEALRAMARTQGATLLGRPVFEVVPLPRAAVERALAGHAADEPDCEFRIRGRGLVRWDVHLDPLFDLDRRVAVVVVTLRDPAARRAAQARIDESERRFAAMADSSPVLLWMSRKDALCTFFNQSWLAFTGRSLEEEQGVGWAEGVHFEDLQRCLDTFLAAFNERRTFEMEYRLRRADGEYRWILDRGAPRYDQYGNFCGYIGSCVDITDRRNAAGALAESEQRLRAVLDTASDAILGLDADGKIVSANRAAASIFRVAETALVGLPVTRLLAELPESPEQAWTALRDRAVRGLELTGLRGDGSAVPIEIALGAAGERFTAVVRDVSERRQLERWIVESREQVQMQVGQDLHDGVGQLLTGAAFIARGLQEAGAAPGAPQLGRLVELINQATREVRLLAKGLSPIHLGDRPLSAILGELVDQTNALSGVECFFEESPAVVEKLDARIKLQIFMIAREAITNAIKHGAARRIVLRLWSGAGQHTLDIDDDGSGVKPNAADNGLGIRSMQYRARLLGGSLEVRPLAGPHPGPSGGGTRVRCSWPDRPPKAVSATSEPLPLSAVEPTAVAAVSNTSTSPARGQAPDDRASLKAPAASEAVREAPREAVSSSGDLSRRAGRAAGRIAKHHPIRRG
jgi:PAS domain S-box-containing protein